MICDVQPMDQAVAATFKIYYISRIVSGGLWATDKNTDLLKTNSGEATSG